MKPDWLASDGARNLIHGCKEVRPLFLYEAFDLATSPSEKNSLVSAADAAKRMLVFDVTISITDVLVSETLNRDVKQTPY